MRVVLDTSVLVAAIRSNSGAANAVPEAGLRDTFAILISTPLLLEYQSVMTRTEHLIAAGLTAVEVDALIDSICIHATEVPLKRSWRPELPDPDDEMVLETALNGKADAIVTLNLADFALVTNRFGIAILKPQDLLQRIRAK